MASIKDVAKKAGVSKSTVSKVLNGYDTISEETKKKVNQAVKELNYYPNQIAVALSKANSKKIAIVVSPRKTDQTIDGLNINYILGASDRFDEMKIEVITIFASLFEEKTVDEATMYLRKRGINGIVLFGIPNNTEVIEKIIWNQDFKVVIIDKDIVNTSTSSISVDNYNAQYQIATEMISRYKPNKILYVAGDDGGDSGQERLQAIKDLKENENQDITIMDGKYSELEAQRLVTKHGQYFQTIICASDLMAIGALRALKQKKIDRPICGFDGIDLLAYIDEKFLTVKQDFYQIGTAAASEIVELLDGKSGEKIIVNHEIGTVKIEEVIK